MLSARCYARFHLRVRAHEHPARRTTQVSGAVPAHVLYAWKGEWVQGAAHPYRSAGSFCYLLVVCVNKGHPAQGATHLRLRAYVHVDHACRTAQVYNLPVAICTHCYQIFVRQQSVRSAEQGHCLTHVQWASQAECAESIPPVCIGHLQGVEVCHVLRNDSRSCAAQ